MNLIEEKIQNEFRFDLDQFLENYPLYSQKGSAVRSLKKRFIQGVDFVEIKDGKRKTYKLTWRCIQRLFFKDGMEIYGQAIDDFVGDLANSINDWEVLARRLQKQVNENTLTLVRHVPLIPIREILKRHGRDSVKEFLSQYLDDLSLDEVAVLKQSWEFLGDFAHANPVIVQPLITVLSFFTNPGILQEEMKLIFEKPKKNGDDPAVEEIRKQWRLRKKRQRDRLKARRIS